MEIKEEELTLLNTHKFASNLEFGVEPFFFDINGDSLVDVLVSIKESPNPLTVFL